MKVYRILVLVLGLLLGALPTFADYELDQVQMLEMLHEAGIDTRMREKTYITPKQSKMLTGKPVSIFSMYVDLQHTRNIRVTAIEFDNEGLAETMDKKSINGFFARNWFFIGIVDTRSTQEIIDAIEQ